MSRIFNYTKKKKLSKIWAKDLNISPKIMWMANKPMERCLASLGIKKMEMKATVKQYCTLTRMAHIIQNKTLTIPSTGEAK